MYVFRYLNMFYDSYQDVLQEKVPISGDADEMVANPLQAFQLVRRLAVEWDFVTKAMKTDDWWRTYFIGTFLILISYSI